MSNELELNNNGFANLGLSEQILKALADSGYENPTPIQAAMIPVLMTGSDVVGQAQTGTGKTAAFALPVLEQIEVDRHEPQALILAPTRELALQVCESFKKYSSHLKGLKTLAVYGGQEYGGQLRSLSRGVHIVVGTPGRVMDHIERGTLNLDAVRILVLDEADEMLRMGFKEDVEWILERAPQDRQIALFSATMPPDIRAISRRFLNKPEEITIREKTATVESTRQRFWQVTGINKLDALSRILEAEPYDAILIFVKTKIDTIEVAEQLVGRGFAAAALNGDIPQNQRERIIEQLKGGKLNIIVATDVAARGLDVDRISHVINYDAPHDPETYVHRIGRTGRAGRSGEAIIFISPRQRRLLEIIEKATRQTIAPMKLPTADFINQKRMEAFKNRIKEAMSSPDLQLFKDLVAQFCAENQADPIEIAAATARMYQGDKPLLLQVKPEHHRAENTSMREFVPETFGRKAPAGRGRGARRDDETQEEGMERYRIEVGKMHGVQPGHIVGAISGETGMASKYIGRIRLYDEFSTVDLPLGMPEEMIRKLKTAWICKRQLEISLDNGQRETAAVAEEQTPRRGQRPAPFPSRQLLAENRRQPEGSERSERPTRARRSEKLEREAAEERHDRPRRSERPAREAGEERRERFDRPARSDNNEKTDKTRKFRGTGKTGHSDRFEKPANIEKTAKERKSAWPVPAKKGGQSSPKRQQREKTFASGR
ncbi:MAG TPA: DEAD/DEAH box helicase [Candidatus Ozemobacteraceae bacterium]|nr:DEAD/DEAH box helicase [Candidatus Ozemobacteraceae bacterium]